MTLIEENTFLIKIKWVSIEITFHKNVLYIGQGSSIYSHNQTFFMLSNFSYGEILKSIIDDLGSTGDSLRLEHSFWDYVVFPGAWAVKPFNELLVAYLGNRSISF